MLTGAVGAVLGTGGGRTLGSSNSSSRRQGVQPPAPQGRSRAAAATGTPGDPPALCPVQPEARAMCSPHASPLAHIFKGTFAHASWSSPMDILQGHLLGVEENGKIAFLEPAEEQEKLAKKWGFKASEIRELNNNEFFMPGLVDTHIHAPQYSFAGTRVDLPLLQWLEKYTFPTEAKFKDNGFAEEVYTRAVRRTLKNGTTTACYFATIHTDASLLLADIIDKFGQRAFVGKVCMDINESFPEYKETTTETIEETERFVRGVLEKKYSKVQPIITPRFGPSCTQELLHSLGNLAKASDIHVQSHISESKGEIKLVEEMFPTYQNYTELYEKNNLLTDKTIMAHGCYLSDEELKLFNLRGAAIAHCPNSNISLRSGLLNAKKVLKYNVKLGLGTDVAGGYSASMLDAIRKAVMTSNVLHLNGENEAALSLKEVFRLATLGGSHGYYPEIPVSG
ncbi:guanine deaminase isoform X2 [Hemicordylus capensis]|uniref:guanine deaminase isoform X2 n=1 Tax=Hemicordylus capensis TaxID=884348 RepID=UPI0023029B22|nr:guanine deaminase isoform X2 [Hemicordylus capensis]